MLIADFLSSIRPVKLPLPLNPPESSDPWAKHYEQRGRSRPPMMQVSARGEVVVPAEEVGTSPAVPLPAEPTPRPASAPPIPPRSASPFVRPASAAPLPGKPLAKIVWESNPQFEFTNEVAMRRAAEEAVAKKRRDALRVWRIVGASILAVLVIGLANELGSSFLRPLPSAEQLAANSRRIGQEIWRLYDKPTQPLAFDSAQAFLFERAGTRRADFDVVTTLRLRADLYAPADSNGAQPYLMLQRSLAEARAKVLKHSLFIEAPALRDAPEMPRLLAVTHRAGEKLVVKVPLAAQRSGWSWTLAPVKLEQRRANRQLTGEVLAGLGEEPLLVFTTSSDRDIMRQKMQEARRYIIAVNTEMLQRGLAE